MAKYGFSVKLDGVSFEEAVMRVTEALQKEGFGILCDIDVAATLKKKLQHEHRPYRILGACNPGYAEKAIEAEPDIGLLLPCNVVVRVDEGGDINVAFMDPETVLGMIDNPDLAKVAEAVRAQLVRASQAVSH